MDVNGRAVVADFGLSCLVSELSGSCHSMTAAAHWMASEFVQIPPESKSSKSKLPMESISPSRHSDMFSFGSIMHYVWSLSAVFTATV